MKRYINLVKQLLCKKTPHPCMDVIGCYIGGRSKDNIYYCDIGNGQKCGLECSTEHGEYIYSGKEELSKV